MDKQNVYQKGRLNKSGHFCAMEHSRAVVKKKGILTTRKGTSHRGYFWFSARGDFVPR